MINHVFKGFYAPLVAIFVALLMGVSAYNTLIRPALSTNGYVMAVKEEVALSDTISLVSLVANPERLAAPMGSRSLSVIERGELMTSPQEVIVRLENGSIIAVTSTKGGYAPGDLVVVDAKKRIRPR